MQLMSTESDKHSNISIAEIETTESTKTGTENYCSRKCSGKTKATKSLKTSVKKNVKSSLAATSLRLTFLTKQHRNRASHVVPILSHTKGPHLHAPEFSSSQTFPQYY